MSETSRTIKLIAVHLNQPQLLRVAHAPTRDDSPARRPGPCGRKHRGREGDDPGSRGGPRAMGDRMGRGSAEAAGDGCRVGVEGVLADGAGEFARESELPCLVDCSLVAMCA
jgi:hypothetical protein